MQRRNKTILLTRSEEENKILYDRLTKIGYHCFKCSLIKYYDVEFDYNILSQCSDIIITSNYAAKILKKRDNIPGVKANNVWVVGKLSANILKEKSYNVKYIASNAKNLKKQLVRGTCDDIIYLASNNITTPMPKAVRQEIFYKVSYKKELTHQEIEYFKQKLNYILLYSENCAKTLVALLAKNNLFEYVADTVIIVISPKVAKVLKDYFHNIVICDNSDEMVEKLMSVVR